MSGIRTHDLVVIVTECIGNCKSKSNYHTITDSPFLLHVGEQRIDYSNLLFSAPPPPLSHLSDTPLFPTLTEDVYESTSQYTKSKYI